MQYKSIVYDLLKQRPRMIERFRKNLKLLPTIEHHARELKTSHEGWNELLLQLRPGSDPNQIASEALDIAVKELEDRLPSELGVHGNQVLDARMLFLRRTPRG